ncbi:MAG: rfaE bifunctional protein nucleotidyltransferase chain/domain [Chitinophagales bacterium]|jgi:rfaE bifunctional protein nucleotidyltransferase chain/domain
MGPKLTDIKGLKHILAQWRVKSNRIVFTNGCFDIIHVGHVHTLKEAKKLGDKLLVGLNSDNSVKRLKGSERPINKEINRADLLSAFEMVDAIIIFEDDTPLSVIEAIQPDVLVKGGDWKIEEIVGGEFVKKNGGEVVSVPFIPNESSSNLIEKIQKL